MDRRFSIEAELRASQTGDGFVIEGRAIKYNSLSKRNVPMAGMCERIAPGCFRASLANTDTEVLALLGHDPNQVLARQSNGSLKLTDGADALRFQIRLNPAIQEHRDLHEKVKSGLLREMSFGFVADKDDYSDGTDDDGKRCQIRTVKSGRLYEISLVATPAYGNDATNAQARAEQAQSEFETSVAALEAFALAATAKKKADDEVRKAEEALRETREQFEKVRLF